MPVRQAQQLVGAARDADAHHRRRAGRLDDRPQVFACSAML
jgi:hypothetical protein